MIDLVLQGPVYPYTEDIIRYYLQSPLVENIVVSCWEDGPLVTIKDSRVVSIYNKPITPAESMGIGNRNCQIHTAQQGLSHVQNNYCAKMRTDQKIHHDSLAMMDRFYKKFCNDTFKSNYRPRSPIFVLGMYTRFPFHPRDHVFWGQLHDLQILFAIPLDETPKGTGEPDYSKLTRAETQIGMYYYARFDSRIWKFIKNPTEYLVDGAPRILETMEVYAPLRDKVFKVFPRIRMEWKKHHMSWDTYPFARNKSMFSEYWHDEEWE